MSDQTQTHPQIDINARFSQAAPVPAGTEANAAFAAGQPAAATVAVSGTGPGQPGGIGAAPRQAAPPARRLPTGTIGGQNPVVKTTLADQFEVDLFNWFAPQLQPGKRNTERRQTFSIYHADTETRVSVRQFVGKDRETNGEKWYFTVVGEGKIKMLDAAGNECPYREYDGQDEHGRTVRKSVPKDAFVDSLQEAQIAAMHLWHAAFGDSMGAG